MTWGDATDLIELLDVRPDGERRWVSRASPRASERDGSVGAGRNDDHRGVVEGGQLLAQAIVAASRHAPGRRVVSASMLFVRAAETGSPLHVELDELSAGRTFTTLSARIVQDDRLRAAGTLLLDTTADDVVRHMVAAPDVPGPPDSEPLDLSVTGRDIRVVDGAYTDAADAPVGPPTIDAWVRFRDVPADPALHAALLAQFTGHMSIAAALRPHSGIGQEEAHRTLSTAINAISIAFHADVRADRWMLYHHTSTFAGDGMTHADCRVHDEAGSLLASFSVDAMVRRFPAELAVDERSAL